MEDPIVPVKSEPSCSTDTTETSRLGLCEVCAYHLAKYTCPKCEVKTCSLRCNKIHKLEIECDGQRDRAKFIPLNKFTNLDLANDYKLLEEAARTLEVSKKKFGRPTYNQHVPAKLFKLSKAAGVRKIYLKFLPFKFARHRNNSSYVNPADLIHWHIDWIFVNADNLKLSDKSVPENEKIGSIFCKYLVKQENAELQEKLKFYQSVNISGIKLYLKAEQKSGKKFYELDPAETLKESLRNKIIIEYPTVHVVLKDHGCIYDIIDSDDEIDGIEKNKIKKEKSGREVVDKIIKAESDENLHSSLKNLLFISEYSDEEISD